MMKVFASFSLILGLTISMKSYASYSLGHREGMLANGGIASTCSAGAAFTNPAGVFCTNYADRTEAYASSALMFTKQEAFSPDNSTKDLQGSQLQTAPGISFFAQSYFTETAVYGVSAMIYQTNQERFLGYTQSNLVGNQVQNVRFGTTAVSLFTGIEKNSVRWGLSLGLRQDETVGVIHSKYLVGADTYSQLFRLNSVQQFLTPSFGAIYREDAFNLSLSISPGAIPLAGSYSSETTTTGTNNSFNESVKNGKTKSDERGGLILGSQWDLSKVSKFHTHLGWNGRSMSERDSKYFFAASSNLGFGYEYQINEKISVLSGIRLESTIQEDSREDKNLDHLLSFGVIRKYKTAELGTTVSYSGEESQTYNMTTARRELSSRNQRLQIALSSSFGY